MNHDQIQLSDKMTSTVKETLKLRSDSISLYALKLIESQEKELKVSDKIIEERERLLIAIPECPRHGKCVPHALEWIEKAKQRKT